MKNFFSRIVDFNRMYRLPTNKVPTLAHQRLAPFYNILEEELEEGLVIVDHFNRQDEEPVDILTTQADWLGDMIVYCASELYRYGLDPQVVLDIIMDSNASKLGADGQPIYDERGKVLKGPGYWKPEPKIKEWIEKQISANEMG